MLVPVASRPSLVSKTPSLLPTSYNTHVNIYMYIYIYIYIYMHPSVAKIENNGLAMDCASRLVLLSCFKPLCVQQEGRGKGHTRKKVS